VDAQSHLGAIEAGAIEVDGQPAYRFRLGVTSQQLAEILWRGAEWPKTWGLYVLLDHDRDQPSVPKAYVFARQTWAARSSAATSRSQGSSFSSALRRRRCGGSTARAEITFTRAGFPTSSYKMSAFAWSEIGHPIVNVVSQVPPHEDYSVPSNRELPLFMVGSWLARLT